MKETTKHCYILNIKAVGLLVSEKKIFFKFSHYKSMGANDHQGVSSLDPRCLTGMVYVGDTKHSYIHNLLALCIMISEKKILDGSLAT